MRTDDHVGQPMQPRQGPVRDGLAPEVPVEDVLLSFDDVQRRSAQPAAFQRRDESLGVDQRAAAGVDDERAVLQLGDPLPVQEMARVGGERRVIRVAAAAPSVFCSGEVMWDRAR